MKSRFSWIEQDRSSNAIRYVGYCVSVLILFIVLFFVYGQFFTSEKVLFTGSADNYDDGWYYRKSTGEQLQVKFPTSISCDDCDEIIFYNEIPDAIQDTQYLCILNRWDMDVYVEDDLRYSFAEDEDEIRGGYVKSHFIMVPVHPRDAGGIVKIVRNVIDLDSCDMNSIYYGDRTGIFGILLARFGTQFLAAVILLVLAIMVMITGYILIIVYRRKMPIIMLAYGFELASLWFIFDSFLYQTFFYNYYVDGPMEYMLIMILPYFFLRYMNYEQKRRYEKLYTVVSVIYIVNFIVMTVLHFACIRPYEQNIIFTSLNALLAIIVFVVTIVLDARKKKLKEYSLVVLGYSMIIVFGGIQIVVLNVRVDNHDALFLMAGMYILLICAFLNMIIKLRQLEDFSRLQERANELKSSFLANMSHEIRTPVNAMLGMNEMIWRESSDSDIKEYSGNIKTAGNTLLDIINDILDFSKIESGKMELVENEYSLSKLIINLNNMISIRAVDKDIRFEVKVEPQLYDALCGDANRIQQILINLLNNAVKYTDAGSVTFSVSEYVEGTATLDNPEMIMIRYEVTDTGRGIRAEDMDKLFLTFERIDIEKNYSIEGTGLGLAITNNLIKLMNGTLSVSSEYGKGSTFTADIPQKIVGDLKIGDFDKLAEKKQSNNVVEDTEKISSLAGANILVVDDVKMNIRVVKGLLKKYQINVTEANSGQECLDKYKENEFDLILLDHMMPEMDGIETLHKLKEKHEKLCPVVVLTANAISGMKEMYLEKGFDDYLSKPTKPEDLEAVIFKYVKRI